MFRKSKRPALETSEMGSKGNFKDSRGKGNIRKPFGAKLPRYKGDSSEFLHFNEIEKTEQKCSSFQAAPKQKFSCPDQFQSIEGKEKEHVYGRWVFYQIVISLINARYRESDKEA